MLALNIPVQWGFQYGTAPLNAMLYEIVFGCLQFFIFFISLLLCFHLFVPVQHQYTTPTGIWQTCVCQLTFERGKWLDNRQSGCRKLFLMVLPSEHHCSWAHRRENIDSHWLSAEQRKKRRNMRSAAPQVNSHLSDIYSRVDQHCQQHIATRLRCVEKAKLMLEVWAYRLFCEALSVNRFQQCGKRTTVLVWSLVSIQATKQPK